MVLSLPVRALSTLLLYRCCVRPNMFSLQFDALLTCLFSPHGWAIGSTCINIPTVDLTRSSRPRHFSRNSSAVDRLLAQFIDRVAPLRRPRRPAPRIRSRGYTQTSNYIDDWCFSALPLNTTHAMINLAQNMQGNSVCLFFNGRRGRCRRIYLQHRYHILLAFLAMA